MLDRRKTEGDGEGECAASPSLFHLILLSFSSLCVFSHFFALFSLPNSRSLASQTVTFLFPLATQRERERERGDTNIAFTATLHTPSTYHHRSYKKEEEFKHRQSRA
jgi:hypothetical protein